jgi:hypothetical protein
MKIENKTKYDTRYLRKLFLACERHIFNTYLIHGESKHRHVTVKTNRKGYIAGYAWYNSWSIVITLPPPVSVHYGKFKEEHQISARRVAQVYLHEVGHNIGLKHKQMIPSLKINVDWLPDETVPLKPQPQSKPKRNIVEIRAEKAQAKLNEWTKKLNRAKTYVKKYQAKVKYYERKRAADS